MLLLGKIDQAGGTKTLILFGITHVYLYVYGCMHACVMCVFDGSYNVHDVNLTVKVYD